MAEFKKLPSIASLLQEGLATPGSPIHDMALTAISNYSATHTREQLIDDVVAPIAEFAERGEA